MRKSSGVEWEVWWHQGQGQRGGLGSSDSGLRRGLALLPLLVSNPSSGAVEGSWDVLGADVDPHLGAETQASPTADQWPPTGCRDPGGCVWVSPGQTMWGSGGGAQPLLFLGSQAQTGCGHGFPEMALADP